MNIIEASRREIWERILASPTRGEHLLLVQHAEDDKDRPPLHPDRTAERIEWAWGKYNRQLSRLNWLDDDRIPYLDCFTGTEIFAAAFGCEVLYPEGEMPFAKPVVSSPQEADTLVQPTLDAPTLAQMFEIGDELYRRGGSGALLRLPDIQSPMDIVGIVWDKNDFFISVVETPESVRRLADKTRSLLMSFLDEWFSRYGRAFIAHFPDYFMPFGISLSEDEIGSIGPDLFTSMFLPELNALSVRYGAIGIHCCAHAQHQWPGLAAVNRLRVLNLVQPEDVLDVTYPFFADKTVQLPMSPPMIVPAPDAPARSYLSAWEEAFRRAGHGTFVFSVEAETDDQAQKLAETFRQAQA